MLTLPEFVADFRQHFRNSNAEFNGVTSVLVQAPDGDDYKGIITFQQFKRAVYRCRFCRAPRRVVAMHIRVCVYCYTAYVQSGCAVTPAAVVADKTDTGDGISCFSYRADGSIDKFIGYPPGHPINKRTYPFTCRKVLRCNKPVHSEKCCGGWRNRPDSLKAKKWFAVNDPDGSIRAAMKVKQARRQMRNKKSGSGKDL